MDNYKLEKIALDSSIELESSNEVRLFSFDPGVGENEWEIEVNADVLCNCGSFTPDIQYIKITTDRIVFYVGDGKYPFFEQEINNRCIDLDWSF